MEISNMDDTIDSRDIMERIKELEDITDTDINTAEEQEELKVLRALAEEGKQSPDWEYGEQFINKNYFTEYCEELCKDIGDIPQDLPWHIANHIDWDGVAREIRMDYVAVDFDGETYFIRA